MTHENEVTAPEYVVDYGDDEPDLMEDLTPQEAAQEEKEQAQARARRRKTRAERVAEMNLTGKDYFTVTEAAHYACVSVRQLQLKGKEYGIYSRSMMGKMVYRRSDISRAMEILWRPLTK